MLALLTACAGAPPLAPDEIRDPALRAIHGAFADTVRSARDDPDVRWRSGWWGNFRLNTGSGEDRGLCYEWQELVYAGVLSTVREQGWRATGIAVNEGWSSEHHAVVVYDPRRTVWETMLTAPAGAAAWVLDAWRRGEPDIFPLAVWVRLPAIARAPPRLEVVEEDGSSGTLPSPRRSASHGSTLDPTR